MLFSIVIAARRTRCTYQDKRTKAGDRPKAMLRRKIGKHWTATCLHGRPQHLKLLTAKKICLEGPNFVKLGALDVWLLPEKQISHKSTGCPTRYWTRSQAGNRLPGWLADRCSVSQQLGALQTHTTDTFLFNSHTTNNILIGVRIIKEMPGSVASGTPCICATCNIVILLTVLCS
jgi:hypothetical protein